VAVNHVTDSHSAGALCNGFTGNGAGGDYFRRFAKIRQLNTRAIASEAEPSMDGYRRTVRAKPMPAAAPTSAGM